MSSRETSSELSSQDDSLLDFSRRAHLTEWMDDPCEYEELRTCLHDLERVNQITFGYRPTLGWLNGFTVLPQKDRPLHIVDVGCGGGDMLRKIERWATRKDMSVRLTGVDLNPHAIRAAREFTSADSRIHWVAGDAYSIGESYGLIDLVISSLFTHHLKDEEIVQFLRWMENVARCGWFINDLARGPKAYTAFTLLSACAGWHRFIRHDGPVSIRRAFTSADWRSYAEKAGLSLQEIKTEGHWPGRLSVSRSRSS